MKKLMICLAATSLAACSLPGSDLRDWMDEVQTQAKNNVRPAEIPTLAKPAEYIDPVITGLNIFDAGRVRPSQQAGVNSPDSSRTKEILEYMSLEKFEYVGHIFRGTSRLALVKAENHTYTVRIGNHMGENHGRITNITADYIVLQEWVEDSLGAWTQRKACLPSPCPESEMSDPATQQSGAIPATSAEQNTNPTN